MLIEYPNAQLIDHINIIKLQCKRKYLDNSHKLLMSLKEQIINYIVKLSLINPMRVQEHMF